MTTRDVTPEEIDMAQRLAAARDAGSEYLCARVLPDGRGVYLMPLFFGALRLGIGPHGSLSFDNVWEYQAEQAEAGWRAAIGWDGDGEPDGWYRHPQSGRRRPGGEASKEFVRP